MVISRSLIINETVPKSIIYPKMNLLGEYFHKISDANCSHRISFSPADFGEKTKKLDIHIVLKDDYDLSKTGGSIEKWFQERLITPGYVTEEGTTSPEFSYL